jgi:hypothetical protein
LADVTLGGETWARALPAADLDALPVEPLESTDDELLAALEPVILVAMLVSCKKRVAQFSVKRLLTTTQQ